jgi:hypothetical protein
LFGYHLFGRPPIHLSDDDDEEEDNNPLYRSRPSRSNRISATGPISATTTIHSTVTVDSDAALLDADTINNLSSSTAEDLAFVEEELRVKEEAKRAKEERRQRKRAQRVMKNMARALAADASIGDDFEGFQGSGGGPAYPGIPSSFMPAEDETVSSDVLDGGERASAPSPASLIPHLAMEEEQLDEAADLDGMMYTRPHRPPSSSSSHRRSNSQSHTSTSSNNINKDKTKKKKSTTKSSSARSKSTLSSNDSTSIASPTSPAFSLPGNGTSIATVVRPTTVEQGQGVFDYEDEPEHQPYTPQALVVKDQPATGFPSTGLGGFRAQGGGGGGVRGGAFLANTAGGGGHAEGEGDSSFDGTF